MIQEPTTPNLPPVGKIFRRSWLGKQHKADWLRNKAVHNSTPTTKEGRYWVAHVERAGILDGCELLTTPHNPCKIAEARQDSMALTFVVFCVALSCAEQDPTQQKKRGDA